MIVTIGEVVDIALPFASNITVSQRSQFPWMCANIVGGTSVTKLFILVKQISEHLYSAVITDDVYNGNRLIPTDTSDPPFIKEKNFLGGDTDDNIIEGKNDMSPIQFKKWFFKSLNRYQIIKFDMNDWNRRIIDLGFNSIKIRKHIDRTIRQMKCGRGDIYALMESINVKHNKFPMDDLEDKEIRCIYAKLKSLGLDPIIVDKSIVKINYEIICRRSV